MTEMISWALTEEVDITLVEADAEGLNHSFLIARLRKPGAFLLTFAESEVKVNGVLADLGADLMYFCQISDELVMDPRGAVAGTTVRVNPPRG